MKNYNRHNVGLSATRLNSDLLSNVSCSNFIDGKNLVGRREHTKS